MSDLSAPPPTKHQRTSIVGWTEKRSASPAAAYTESPSASSLSPDTGKRNYDSRRSEPSSSSLSTSVVNANANATASSSSSPAVSTEDYPCMPDVWRSVINHPEVASQISSRYAQMLTNGLSPGSTKRMAWKIAQVLRTTHELAPRNKKFLSILTEFEAQQVRNRKVGQLDALAPPPHHRDRRGKFTHRRLARESAFKSYMSKSLLPDGSVVFIPKGPLPAPTLDTPSIEEAEYSLEVPEYMIEMDKSCQPNAWSMDGQPEVQWYMRPFLVDFLIEVHHQFRLRPEVLYLAMNIVDRYVSRRIVYKKHYQLVGCTALWISAKFEDAKDKVPLVKELSEMCCKAYDETAFIQMEGHVLSTVNWTLGYSTPEAWLRVYCAGEREETKTAHIARFVMELSIFYRDFVGVNAYDVAAGALMLARYICGLDKRADLASERPAMFGPTSAASAVRVARLLDSKLADFANQVSDVMQRKYNPAYYSNASLYVREWYSDPTHRFEAVSNENPHSKWRQANHIANAWRGLNWKTASSSPSASFSSTASSENGDEGPLTPNTPSTFVTNAADPFTAAQQQQQHLLQQQQQSQPQQRGAKENIAPAPTPTRAKLGQVVPTHMTALPAKSAHVAPVQDVAMLYPARPALNALDHARRQDQQPQALRRLSN